MRLRLSFFGHQTRLYVWQTPNTAHNYRELQLGRRFIFQQDNESKHPAKAAQKRFKDNKVTVLERPSQSPDLSPTENLWLDLKSCSRLIPEQPDGAGAVLQGRMEKTCRCSRCSSLIETHPHRLRAETAAKGASTEN